jgi:uncharacterized membrane protein YphA (DoxX/SURF4 family)
LVVLAVVALRLAVGWHFFREGADKMTAGDFSSAGFMESAKGPLAPAFRNMVWDVDGLARLDEQATLDAWNQYRVQVGRRYGFDDTQTAEAEKVYEARKKQLEGFFEQYAEDIEIYRKGVERRARNRKDAAYAEVASLEGQAARIKGESKGDGALLLESIAAIRRGYERELNALATEEQAGRGPIAMKKPARKPMDTVFIDSIIPTFDLVVGALLIVGLFTRPTCLAGAGFLATIIATQWPGAPGAIPAHYQIVEMFALLVLAAIGAGRFFGLDFFVGLIWTPSLREKTRNKPLVRFLAWFFVETGTAPPQKTESIT